MSRVILVAVLPHMYSKVQKSLRYFEYERYFKLKEAGGFPLISDLKQITLAQAS